MLIVNTSLWIFWYQIRECLIPIFTQSEDILNEGLAIFPLVLMFIFFDFFQASTYGSIKALGLQNKAIWVNLLAHYFMILPFAYILGFKVISSSLSVVE